MPSTILFIVATFLLSLNLIRPLGLAVSDWLYFGALGFALLETFLMQRRHTFCWWQNRFLWAVALILIGAIVSTMNSQDWVIALVEIFQQTFVMTLFVSLTWIMVRRGKTKTLLLAFILSGVLAAAIALMDYLTGSRLGPVLSGTPTVQLWGRFAGPLGHPNKLGYYLVLTTLLSLDKLMNVQSRLFVFPARLLWGVLIAVQIFAIYLSGSMSAYLGLITGFVLFALSSKLILGRVTRTFGVAAATVTLVVAFWFIATPVLINDLPSLKENSIARAFNRVQTDTAGSRMATYAQAWEEITQNPWFGVGYDQISTSGVSASSRFLDFSVHNPLLQIWYTGGIFAFIGWTAIYLSIAWLAITVLRKAWQRPSSLYIVGLAAATLALLLMDQFQDSIYQREKWLVIGLLCGVAWENIHGQIVEEPAEVAHD